MRSKLFSLMVVFALLLGTFGTALAQEMPKPFCGDLAAEDCDLLMASQEAMMGVTSYKSAATYDAVLSGIPGLPAKEVAVSVAVGGAFSSDEAALAAMQSMVGKTQADIVAMLAEDGTPLVDLLSGWNVDATVSVDMTPELADAFAAQAGGIAIPATASVGIILVNGVLYADLTEIAPLAPGVPEGWIGISVAELVQAQVDAGVFAAAAAQMDPAALDPTTAAALGVQGMLMGDMSAMEQFITVERVDDTDVDGQAAAVIVTSFDVGGLVASPEFADLVKTLAASGALGADAPSAADIDQVLTMIPMVGPMIFEGLSVGGSTTIGIDDNFVYDATAEFMWDLSGLIQMAAMSGQLPEGIVAGDTVAIDIMTDIADSEFNVEQTIEAPADAMMIPLEAFAAPAQ